MCGCVLETARGCSRSCVFAGRQSGVLCARVAWGYGKLLQVLSQNGRRERKD
jgi:hypothetical protein